MYYDIDAYYGNGPRPANAPQTKEQVITRYKNKYGNKRLTRYQLEREDQALYRALAKHGLLEELLQPDQRINTANIIRWYRHEYKGRKIDRRRLYKEHPWAHRFLRKQGLLDTICK